MKNEKAGEEWGKPMIHEGKESRQRTRKLMKYGKAIAR